MTLRFPSRFVLLATVLLGSCAGDDTDGAASGDDVPSLPSGMAPPPVTNADARPPAVPLDPATPVAIARAAARWPHDTAAYTQGLVVHDGRLLEGVGQEGRSDVREVRLETGDILRRVPIRPKDFGEGIAVHGDRLYQLTWKGGRGYIYDVRTLVQTDSFAYRGEGWGLASDGRVLYLSDGSSAVRVLDPATRRELRTLAVNEAGKRVWMLNELELVRGELWANIYQTGFIARIDTATGAVRGYVNVDSLLSPAEREFVRSRGGTANGIAYDAERRRLLVTGKLWPALFAIELPQQ